MAVNRTICFGNGLYEIIEKEVEEGGAPTFNKFVNDAVRHYIELWGRNMVDLEIERKDLLDQARRKD